MLRRTIDDLLPLSVQPPAADMAQPGAVAGDDGVRNGRQEEDWVDRDRDSFHLSCFNAAKPGSKSADPLAATSRSRISAPSGRASFTFSSINDRCGVNFPQLPELFMVPHE
jgi:hypothetical protein